MTNLPLQDCPKYFNHSSWFTILCSPNEDFGRLNKRSRIAFRCTLHGCEYSIWATIRCKVHRKDMRDRLFSLPKSSFGEHTYWENPEKAGLSKIDSKWGTSCTRLICTGSHRSICIGRDAQSILFVQKITASEHMRHG